jgi:hypothetical protein
LPLIFLPLIFATRRADPRYPTSVRLRCVTYATQLPRRKRGGTNPVSSAILYVAIVAIWACVLIPRWLRRDSARGAGGTADTPVPGDVVPGDVIPAEDAADDLASMAERVSAVRVRYSETFRADVTVEAEADLAPEEVPEPDAGRRVPPPPRPEESRRRMLAARRRLLGMLIVLEIAAGALSALKLAALWVLIPPSIMLIGYVLLLREASHADAERAQREEEAARARIRAQERARERAARQAAAARAAQAVPTAPPAPPAPPARYEDAGRDFAPGLAGKYTTSNADVTGLSRESGEDHRDEYPQRLRAVGD